MSRNHQKVNHWLTPNEIKSVFRPLAVAAIKQGWRIKLTNGNHLCWVSPLGAIVFTSSTPAKTDRILQQVKRDLRQNGMDCSNL